MKRLVMALTVLGLMAAPALASYGTIELKHDTVSPSKNIKIYGAGYENGQTVKTGLYHHDLRNPNPAGLSVTRQGFCIEFQNSSTQWKVYDVVDVEFAPEPNGPGGSAMGTTKADLIRELWAAHYGDVVDANSAAAFQLAVWEIVYEDAEGTLDVTSRDETDKSNSFKADAGSTIATLANGWLGALDGSGPMANLLALTNDSAQDYVVDIPAPAAVALGIFGVGLVGWVKRRTS